jgi:hypothetical protein
MLWIVRSISTQVTQTFHALAQTFNAVAQKAVNAFWQPEYNQARFTASISDDEARARNQVMADYESGFSQQQMIEILSRAAITRAEKNRKQLLDEEARSRDQLMAEREKDNRLVKQYELLMLRNVFFAEARVHLFDNESRARDLVLTESEKGHCRLQELWELHRIFAEARSRLLDEEVCARERANSQYILAVNDLYQQICVPACLPASVSTSMSWTNQRAEITLESLKERARFKSRPPEMVLEFMWDVYGPHLDVEIVVPPRKFRLDYVCKTSRGPVVVELDGEEHFTALNWQGKPHFNDVRSTLDKRRARDVYKMLWWIRQGRRMIRLHQADMRRTTFDWRTKLREAIDNGVAPVIYLEALDVDSWKAVRSEVEAWQGTAESWYAINYRRL